MAFPAPTPRSELPWNDPSGPPTSILVYARSRQDLDPVMAALARRVSPDAVWIEVVDPADPPGPAETPSLSVSGAFTRRFEFEPSELVPDQGRANLLLWGAGRPEGDSHYLQDLEDLAWLPKSLTNVVPIPPPGEPPTPVVLARAERMVLSLPLGVDDVARLLGVLERRRITLIAGLLFRPFPEFTRHFKHVLRVRPGGSEGEPPASVIEERPP